MEEVYSRVAGSWGLVLCVTACAIVLLRPAARLLGVALKAALVAGCAYLLPAEQPTRPATALRQLRGATGEALHMVVEAAGSCRRAVSSSTSHKEDDK